MLYDHLPIHKYVCTLSLASIGLNMYELRFAQLFFPFRGAQGLIIMESQTALVRKSQRATVHKSQRVTVHKSLRAMVHESQEETVRESQG